MSADGHSATPRTNNSATFGAGTPMTREQVAMRFISVFAVACGLSLFAIDGAAQESLSGIGSEREVTVRDYCVARGSGGRDGYGTGRYVAPNGNSIVNAETIPTRCVRCSIRTTTFTQPGFVSLKQESGVDYTKALTDYAESMEDKARSLKLLAVTGIANNIRVVEGTSHAVVEHACHGESRRFTIRGHDNGWGYYNLRVVLRREPTGTDYATLLLELISATEAGDSERFNSVIDAIREAE